MAKSKNHTNHNQNQKDHKNGIKRIQRPLYKGALVGKCMKGVYPKYHEATKKSKAALRVQRVEAAKQRRDLLQLGETRKVLQNCSAGEYDRCLHQVLKLLGWNQIAEDKVLWAELLKIGKTHSSSVPFIINQLLENCRGSLAITRAKTAAKLFHSNVHQYPQLATACAASSFNFQLHNRRTPLEIADLISYDQRISLYFIRWAIARDHIKAASTVYHFVLDPNSKASIEPSLRSLFLDRESVEDSWPITIITPENTEFLSLSDLKMRSEHIQVLPLKCLKQVQSGWKDSRIIGIDCESSPAMIQGDESHLGLIQLAFRNVSGDLNAFLFYAEISDLQCWKDFFSFLESDCRGILVGMDFIRHDLKIIKAKAELEGNLSLKLVPNYLDISDFIANQSKESSKTKVSLMNLTSSYLGKPLNKDIQISNWLRRPLHPAQMVYAALDAACLVAIAELFGDENLHSSSKVINL